MSLAAAAGHPHRQEQHRLVLAELPHSPGGLHELVLASARAERHAGLRVPAELQVRAAGARFVEEQSRG